MKAYSRLSLFLVQVRPFMIRIRSAVYPHPNLKLINIRSDPNLRKIYGMSKIRSDPFTPLVIVGP
jgi:hypothetical protein